MKRRYVQFATVLILAAAIAGLLSQLVLGGSDRVKIGNGAVSEQCAVEIDQEVLDGLFYRKLHTYSEGQSATTKPPPPAAEARLLSFRDRTLKAWLREGGVG